MVTVCFDVMMLILRHVASTRRRLAYDMAFAAMELLWEPVFVFHFRSADPPYTLYDFPETDRHRHRYEFDMVLGEIHALDCYCCNEWLAYPNGCERCMNHYPLSPFIIRPTLDPYEE